MHPLNGTELIAAERARQVRVEGYNANHDATHTKAELIDAAVCYAGAARQAINGEGLDEEFRRLLWPFAETYWKPSPDPVRNLVKAGALIAAEIDRLSAVD